MSRVFVHGEGAVGPAGWGVAALRGALEGNQPLPVKPLARPGWEKSLEVRPVPLPAAKLPFLAHARLRRASPMTHYSMASALEALGNDIDSIKRGEIRLGIIASTMTGGISYSRRFYQEVLQDPATASPLIFPETVFNATASHISAFLNVTVVNYTLVGDAAAFLQSAAIAAQWLADDVADACLIIGAEELDWTGADAFRLFEPGAVHTTGAGALYLKEDSSSAVELSAITDLFPIPRSAERQKVANEMRSQLTRVHANELLCRAKDDENNWQDWQGEEWVPENILGEAFVATAAWQCVAACDALRRGKYDAATISISGRGRQTIGAQFINPAVAKIST